MSLPDEQELDRIRSMVSPAAVQRSQTVSHKHPERPGLKLLRGGLKHQLSLKRKALHMEQSEDKGFSKQPPPKVPQTARPETIILLDPPTEDQMAQPLKVTERRPSR